MHRNFYKLSLSPQVTNLFGNIQGLFLSNSFLHQQEEIMKNKWLLSAGLIFGLIVLWRIGVLIFSDSSAASGRSGRPPVAVEVDSVRFGPISEIRQLTGTVYARYQYVLAPKVAGRIIAIYKRIGDAVKSGELIARLDDAEYEQGVIEARANLKIAEASLNEALSQFELARQEKERVEMLQAKGISSPAELDAAISNYSAQESRYQLARAQVEQRQAALTAANIRLSYTRLLATQPGFIGERFVDEGALLAPNAAVVSIIGIDSVIVRTTIIERDYGFIVAGQTAEVTVDAFPGQRFTGKVSRIAPMLQEASRVAQMEVEVANDSLLLKPGMFARVLVVTASKEQTRQVPTRAIVNRAGESIVFLVDPEEKIARLITVKTGISTAEFTEIIEPDLEGLVVTLGQHLLDDSSPVLISARQSGAATAVKEK